VIFTEKFLAFEKRDWLGFFAFLMATGCLVGLWFHITHYIPPEPRLIHWGWRHYVGVTLNYAPVTVFPAILLWLAVRRYLK
jgi:hypothetical protein